MKNICLAVVAFLIGTASIQACEHGISTLRVAAVSSACDCDHSASVVLPLREVYRQRVLAVADHDCHAAAVVQVQRVRVVPVVHHVQRVQVQHVQRVQVQHVQRVQVQRVREVNRVRVERVRVERVRSARLPLFSSRTVVRERVSH
jgi:hypothetical protein